MKLFKKARRACLFAAAGAAGAYLLDPERGAARRAKTKEKFQSVKGQAGSQASKMAQQAQTAVPQAQTTTAQAASQAQELTSQAKDLKTKVTGDTSAGAAGAADDGGGGSSDGESDGDGPSDLAGSGVPLKRSGDAVQEPEPSEASDQRLADAVREHLETSGISTSDIAVDAADGVVALRGSVETAQLGSRISREAGTVDGVKEVKSFLHQAGESVPSGEKSSRLP